MLLKLESEQVTNSFKMRGALNCIRSVVEKGMKAFATASTGTHGMAVMHVSKVMDVTDLSAMQCARNKEPSSSEWLCVEV